MEASKTTNDAAAALSGFGELAQAAAAGTAAASGTDAKEKALLKKQKGGERKKKADGASTGKRGVSKSTAEKKPKKERPDEAKLLKGISKPATRRMFKQIYNHSKLRLADNATDSIRATMGVTTRRVVQAMVAAVAAVKRQTSYMCDARAAVRKELPRSNVFPVPASA